MRSNYLRFSNNHSDKFGLSLMIGKFGHLEFGIVDIENQSRRTHPEINDKITIQTVQDMLVQVLQYVGHCKHAPLL